MFASNVVNEVTQIVPQRPKFIYTKFDNIFIKLNKCKRHQFYLIQSLMSSNLPAFHYIWC